MTGDVNETISYITSYNKRRPEGSTSLLCQYLACGTRMRLITITYCYVHLQIFRGNMPRKPEINLTHDGHLRCSSA